MPLQQHKIRAKIMEPKMSIPDAARFLNITSQAVLKKMKNNKLERQKVNNRVYFGHSTSNKLFNLSVSPSVIATQIVKGGTGKSTITMAIAIRANLYGLKVLCIDLDQQANLSILFGITDVENYHVMYDVIKSKGKLKIERNLIEISTGLHLFPSKLENAALDDMILIQGLGVDRVYKDIIIPLKDYYDLILIDCPPALGRSVAAAAHAADKIISPVIPDKLCLTGLRLLHNLLEEIKESKYGRKIPYEIVYNRFDGRTNLSKEVLSSLLTSDIYKERLNPNYIRQCQEFSNSAAKKNSIYDSLITSSAQEDIDSLTRNLLGLEDIKNNSFDDENQKRLIISVSSDELKPDGV
jgi:chromosome partitioning protein